MRLGNGAKVVAVNVWTAKLSLSFKFHSLEKSEQDVNPTYL